MAGLLDIPGGYWGDTTTKDPTTGLTQADRRDPIWAGLISGGMGLLAAGQDLKPEQRAQLMAQAGQTYGGIPAAMMAQKTAGAQQVLQQQQVKAGQAKLDTQARLAAMAKTPEFQEAVAKLEPDQRLMLQAALDAGDMAHATTILSSASRERTAAAERARQEARADAKDAAKAAADAAKEAGFGNTPYGINARNLRDAPIDSYAYFMAHQFFSTEQKNPDGTIIAKLPGLEKLPLPEWTSDKPPAGTPGRRTAAPKPDDPNAPKPPEPDPNAPKPPVQTPLKPGEVRKDEATGIETWTDGERTYKAFPDDRVEIRDKAGNLVGTEQPKDIPPAAQTQMIENKAFRDQLQSATQTFLQRWRAASPIERGKAIVNKGHPLNSAWANVMFFAKGKNLYELGVLNEGDLPQLQKAITDPSTALSAFSKAEDVDLQLGDIMRLVDVKLESTRKSYEQIRRRRPPKGGTGAGAGASGPLEYITNPADPNGPPILKRKD